MNFKSRYTLLFKYGKCTRDFWGCLYFYYRTVFSILEAFFNKKIIPLAFVAYEDYSQQLGTVRLTGYLLSYI